MLSWSSTATGAVGGQPSSSSGPGHRPFKAAARVRIPLGAPAAPCARLFLAHSTRSRGAVWSARHPVKVEAAGSNPVGTARHEAADRRDRRLASAVSRDHEDFSVSGSLLRNACQPWSIYSMLGWAPELPQHVLVKLIKLPILQQAPLTRTNLHDHA